MAADSLSSLLDRAHALPVHSTARTNLLLEAVVRALTEKPAARATRKKETVTHPDA